MHQWNRSDMQQEAQSCRVDAVTKQQEQCFCVRIAGFNRSVRLERQWARPPSSSWTSAQFWDGFHAVNMPQTFGGHAEKSAVITNQNCDWKTFGGGFLWDKVFEVTTYKLVISARHSINAEKPISRDLIHTRIQVTQITRVLSTLANNSLDLEFTRRSTEAQINHDWKTLHTQSLPNIVFYLPQLLVCLTELLLRQRHSHWSSVKLPSTPGTWRSAREELKSTSNQPKTGPGSV